MTAFLGDKSHFEGMLSAFSNDLIYRCFLTEHGMDYVFFISKPYRYEQIFGRYKRVFLEVKLTVLVCLKQNQLLSIKNQSLPIAFLDSNILIRIVFS